MIKNALLFKSLTHYWRINLAILFGAALATAILTGALLVGDSMRGSLRDMTLERLGKIDIAINSGQFFRAKLADDLQAETEFKKYFRAAVPIIQMNGAINNRTAKTRASNVSILGVDQRFYEFFPTGDYRALLKQQEDASQGALPAVLVNNALAKELNAAAGDQVIINFETISDIHRESLFGNKKSEAVIGSMRARIAGIIPDKAAGRFSLNPNQILPVNIYLPLSELQKRIGREDQANQVLLSLNETAAGDSGSDKARQLLESSLQLADAGYSITIKGDAAELSSAEYILKPEISDIFSDIAPSMNLPAMPLLTYLANNMQVGDNYVPYSTVTALNAPQQASLGSLTDLQGQHTRPAASDDIFINTWTADQLNAKVGDPLIMRYYEVGPNDELIEREDHFTVAAILTMSGLASDPDLTPEYPGVSGTDDIRDWEPPFEMDLDLIRPQDEKYWDDYRGTPKAFVSLSAGQKLWQSRFGNLTAIRFSRIPGKDLATTIAEVKNALRASLTAEELGFYVQPVKQEGLLASRGATDFSGMFIGFSLFLIVSSALLIALLFRLNVEQRGKEAGILAAGGFSRKKITRRFLGEGIVLAIAGGLLGIIGAVAYAGLMMAGLRNLWIDATGTQFLFLYVQPASLIAGFLITLVVVVTSIYLALKKLQKIAIPGLLGGQAALAVIRSGRVSAIVGSIALVLSLLMLAYGITGGVNTSTALFFPAGALLLVAGITLTASRLRRPKRNSGMGNLDSLSGLLGSSAGNVTRHPGRSILCISLVACATFMIIAVGANRRDFSQEDFTKNPGVGGYALVAESDIPLHQDLNSDEGRFDLGFSDKDIDLLKTSPITAFRLLPGEDASCLNLYQPEKPRILGVPEKQIRRGGFQFQQILNEDGRELPENPWEILKADPDDDVIPGFADFESAMWILHKPLGDTIIVKSESGAQLKIRLVGLFSESIFQSEVLISETHFKRYFPSRSGYRYFLADSKPENQQELSSTLESVLEDYGFDAVKTTEKLAGFHAVRNTYLSVFQLLGSLGLLLGTIGLGIILFRNVIERRGEFATLRAFGFRESLLSKMLLTENTLLIVGGVGIGSVAAIIAVLPQLLLRIDQVPLLSLSFTLLAVLAAGFAASWVAVRHAIKMPLLPALKAE